ncbi:MAG: 30S ribosomal protein S24e [Methanocellales archaeon]
MNIKIVEEKTNQLIKRREILFKIEHQGPTPKREEVKDKLAALLNSKPELIIIKYMRSEFGKRETTGRANIYESEERLKQFEPLHLIQRGKKEKGEEKGEEKAEEKEKGEKKQER